LEAANKQNRVLITFDSDFGELIFRQKLKAGGVILLKFTPKSTQQVVDTTLKVLKTQAKIEGHFLIVKEKKIRVLSINKNFQTVIVLFNKMLFSCKINDLTNGF
jgi:hypothetical protein